MQKYSTKKQAKKRRWKLVFVCLILFLGLFFINKLAKNKVVSLYATAVNYIHPSKQTEVSNINKEINLNLPWPSYGQSAYSPNKDSIIFQSNKDLKPVPFASVAKIITALAVLEKKPLKVGEQGENITLTAQDVEFYNQHIANLGSVVPVNEGEVITEYQALQAMLLPSANNIADSLAVWVFGSKENYVDYANNMLRDLKLNDTKVADPSGYSPQTVSTAPELIKLGYKYIENPVLLEIAKQPTANIPVAGEVKNYNATFNQNGMIGIKVGFTDEAGRTFLAIKNNKDGSVAMVSVLGADDFPTAMQDALSILEAGDSIISTQ